MKTYGSAGLQSDLDELIVNIKENQLDKLYTRFLLISGRELTKIERASQNGVAPLNDDLLRRFESIARVTRDISTELRNYQRDKIELDDNQLLQLIEGMLTQKPHLAAALGMKKNDTGTDKETWQTCRAHEWLC